MPGFQPNQFVYIRDMDLSNKSYYALKSCYWFKCVREYYSSSPNNSNLYKLLGEQVLGFDLEINGKTAYHNASVDRIQAGKKLIGITNIRRTDDGCYTALPNPIIRQLGEPLHLPMLPPSLTYTPPENFARPPHRMQVSGKWVDRRGAVSCIGSNYRQWVSNQGARRAITCRGYRHTMEHSKTAEYKIKYVPGSIASQAGNFFLYSQRLNIYNPYTEEDEVVTWIGLASCMSIQYLYRNIHATQNVLNLLSASRLGPAVNPFQTFNPNAPSNIKWTEANWDKMVNQDLSEYAKPAHPQILETLAAIENLFTTPAGIKLQRMEDLAEAKRQELDTLERNLKVAQAELATREEAIMDGLRKIQEIRLTMQRQQEEIPVFATASAKLGPEVSLRSRMYAKIEAGVVKKRTAFELKKAAFVSEGAADGQSTYAEGLARSGLVIDELIYENKVTGNAKRASEDPAITVSRDWKLIKALMHTTRPIKMHFGLEGKRARASGPHKLEAYMHRSAVKLKISALVPWAAVGWHDEEYFKPYPHVSEKSVGIGLGASDLSQYITTYEPDVCLGELAATASSAFNNNNPKMLALAILSYLQSVNPTDEWGKTYKWFPFWDDIQKDLKPSTFEHWKGTAESVHRPKYYISDCRNWFFEVHRVGGSCTGRWGRLRLIDGEYVETTSKFAPAFLNRNYNVPYYVMDMNKQWKYSPYTVVRQKHEDVTVNWSPKHFMGPPYDAITL